MVRRVQWCRCPIPYPDVYGVCYRCQRAVPPEAWGKVWSPRR